MFQHFQWLCIYFVVMQIIKLHCEASFLPENCIPEKTRLPFTLSPTERIVRCGLLCIYAQHKQFHSRKKSVITFDANNN